MQSELAVSFTVLAANLESSRSSLGTLQSRPQGLNMLLVRRSYSATKVPLLSILLLLTSELPRPYAPDFSTGKKWNRPARLPQSALASAFLFRLLCGLVSNSPVTASHRVAHSSSFVALRETWLRGMYITPLPRSPRLLDRRFLCRLGPTSAAHGPDSVSRGRGSDRSSAMDEADR